MFACFGNAKGSMFCDVFMHTAFKILYTFAILLLIYRKGNNYTMSKIFYKITDKLKNPSVVCFVVLILGVSSLVAGGYILKDYLEYTSSKERMEKGICHPI